MPDISENRQKWDGTDDWSQEGDEWSESWGTHVRNGLVAYSPASSLS